MIPKLFVCLSLFLSHKQTHTIIVNNVFSIPIG